MGEEYVKIKNLSISEKLLNFVNDELLPGTKIKKENFWNGFNKYVHELSPKNKELLENREKLQKKIDEWHKDRKGEKFYIKKYTEFLKKIGYLKKSGPNFKINTKNVDNEISSICGPQLVCPISNERFILNAA
ncbi:MAG: malate synthase G, partial [Candidatus Pelagibacter sp.]|nr:malate synthase G [Candidatus Pelagibacter sp.]